MTTVDVMITIASFVFCMVIMGIFSWIAGWTGWYSNTDLESYMFWVQMLCAFMIGLFLDVRGLIKETGKEVISLDRKIDGVQEAIIQIRNELRENNRSAS